LTEAELDLTRKVFERIDPTKKVAPNLQHKDHYIDPMWDPFKSVEESKEKVTAEFDAYSRLITTAESRRLKKEMERSLKAHQYKAMYNPYSVNRAGKGGKERFPTPHHLKSDFWDPTPLQASIDRERITWRDIDIIQHFVANNGYILPRRVTMLSKQQQRKMSMAVKTAQMLCLLPHDWTIPDWQAMPLTDPIQWMADRLMERYQGKGDLRARAMLQVMVSRYPKLNFYNFFKLEAEKREELDKKKANAQAEMQGNFSHIYMQSDPMTVNNNRTMPLPHQPFPR